MDQDTRETLARLYYDPKFPESLTGMRRFFTGAKRELPNLKFEHVKEFLSQEIPYQLHAPVRRNFKRSRVFVRGPSQVVDQAVFV